MATINILDEENSAMKKYSMRDQALVSWVMDHVDGWEDHRDMNYKSKWDEYERLWRGKWVSQDKTRDSERSRLINPALQQAIEATRAELEESTFGKGKYWFDLDDDIMDQDKEDALFVRGLLLEDMDQAKIPNEVAKVFLYGCIFGTGIGKVLVTPKTKKKIIAASVESVMGNRPEARTESYDVVEIGLEAIDPRNFVIDPAARSIEESLGCAMILAKPTHTITAKQNQGIYNAGKLGSYDNVQDLLNNDEGVDVAADYTKLVEYHGFVPTALLAENLSYVDDDEEDIDLEVEADYDDTELTEAVITIANDSVLLRAIANPHLMGDRGFVAYQHDLIPNSFWGRGVAEKGYNPQKALDAELRARIDVMGLVAHPMMAADSTKLPRGQTLTVRPGKMFLTTADPSAVFMPFKFGNLDVNSFAQAADLERMIQTGTGAVDTAAPVGMNARNATASGMSMMTASTLKRQKMAKQNVDDQFLRPLINKILWRQIQYNPERYPIQDHNFIVRSTMGIMAREYEQAQLTQLLSVIPQDSPVFNIIVKGIITNSSLENKAELLKAIETLMQPSPEQQQEQAAQKQIQDMLLQLEVQNKALSNEKLKSETAENYAQAQTYGLKTMNDNYNAETNRLTAITNASKPQTGAKQ